MTLMRPAAIGDQWVCLIFPAAAMTAAEALAAADNERVWTEAQHGCSIEVERAVEDESGDWRITGRRVA
ncbi:hypothetical protein DYI24_00905 [Rhodopseudomonas sp. BR0C11]|uniref:hypothetical protein n=1 Tax=Rhodopseudomonas sp. BR0C11 TaxID=2269370 RepID=UPI0013DF8042|nr:hypothetical protein [Rhodopseudomonas sp. BR0C11]NEV75628.1 hypothetical protein [Rhodopseudomonas sp. BR0C11]